MDVIKSRNASSRSETVAHAMRCFYTKCGEYMMLYSDFRTLSQPAVVAVLRPGSTVGDVGLVP